MIVTNNFFGVMCDTTILKGRRFVAVDDILPYLNLTKGADGCSAMMVKAEWAKTKRAA